MTTHGIDAVEFDVTMSDSPCIHHIEVGVTDGPQAVAALQHQYRFTLVGTRTTSLADQWVLSKNDTRFVVTCLKNDRPDAIQADEYILDWMAALSDKNIPRKDSVFNVCLQVCDLDLWVTRLEENGVQLVKGLRTVSDSLGSVKVCTIKSCVGDVYHTLVENKHYAGPFLPGFERVQSHPSNLASKANVLVDSETNSQNKTPPMTASTTTTPDSIVSDKGVHGVEHVLEDVDSKDATSVGCDKDCRSTCSDKTRGGQSDINYSQNGHDPKMHGSDWSSFDHVLLAVKMGTTPQIIEWYERLFGMKRFLINSEDTPESGLVLSSNTVGLRLRAMEYWKCAEVGLRAPTSGPQDRSRLFFVIAEGLPPLPGVTECNQIESWMRQHHGPGIQHIAFNSSDIKSTVGNLKAHGVAFANPPPPAYYTQVGRLQDIIDAGEDVDLLRHHGILIDMEADGLAEDGDLTSKPDTSGESYLLQIFTQPVFKGDPFFMEIIQREGATGFGSGNVAALYRSVQSYIVDKERQEA